MLEGKVFKNLLKLGGRGGRREESLQPRAQGVGPLLWLRKCHQAFGKLPPSLCNNTYKSWSRNHPVMLLICVPLGSGQDLIEIVRMALLGVAECLQ